MQQQQQNITAVLDTLMNFSYSSNEHIFSEVFGDDGKYMAKKYFIECNRNIVNFYNYLDSNNRNKFTTYLATMQLMANM